MNLIISASLSTDPPSEGLYFRLLTMIAQKDLNYDVALEADKELIDFYYHFLKKRGWYDFVNGLVTPEENEEGVRIDTSLSYPRTVLAKHIRCENTTNILSQLRSLREITF